MSVGVSTKHRTRDWVQTERQAHEAWASLISRKPRAAELLHHLVAQMNKQNAVVVAQSTLAQLMGRSIDTVQRAISVLVAERWIQVVHIGKGKEAAYVVNDRVAWSDRRDKLCLSSFSATVVASIADQETATLDHAALRRIPTLYPGEQQLPSGPGEEPPSQPSIPGMEPDLPALSVDEQYRDELEQRGQQRIEE
jgi:dihydroxyacetone kinase DhaKLM complex PTS-EIIA-like component DhaM